MNKLVRQPAAWIMNGRNYILKGDGFFISYNPDTSASRAITELGNAVGMELADGTETALIREEDDRNIYRILTGDFRDDYEQAISGGWNACYQLFKSKQAEYGNNWSTLEEDR